MQAKLTSSQRYGRLDPHHKSILHYRQLAVRQLAGETTLDIKHPQKQPAAGEGPRGKATGPDEVVAWGGGDVGEHHDAVLPTKHLHDKGIQKVAFKSAAYSVLESAGAAK